MSALEAARSCPEATAASPRRFGQLIVSATLLGFWPDALVAEKLGERHGLTLAARRCARGMIAIGLWLDRSKRLSGFIIRVRAGVRGELVQIAGGEHCGSRIEGRKHAPGLCR